MLPSVNVNMIKLNSSGGSLSEDLEQSLFYDLQTVLYTLDNFLSSVCYQNTLYHIK